VQDDHRLLVQVVRVLLAAVQVDAVRVLVGELELVEAGVDAVRQVRQGGLADGVAFAGESSLAA
jgi:hypothetical protein